jgi:hypothetical protein
MSQTLSPSILGRLLEPLGNTMPLDDAKALVEYRASPGVQARVDELADKCNRLEKSGIADSDRHPFSQAERPAASAREPRWAARSGIQYSPARPLDSPIPEIRITSLQMG